MNDAFIHLAIGCFLIGSGTLVLGIAHLIHLIRHKRNENTK